MDEKESERGSFTKGATIALALLGLGGFFAYECKYEPFDSRNYSQEAIVKSAGEDRIWDDNEKRQFLDRFGITNIIQASQPLYLEKDGNMIRTYRYDGNIKYTLGEIPLSEIKKYLEK